jgi:vacuolar protein sorting-associated protein 13A/C
MEGFVCGLVDKYLSPYAEVDADEVRSGVRRGEIVLNDVKLKTSAFDNLEMPITVKSGKIGEVRLQMSLRCLSASPAFVVLKDVEVVVGPAGRMASAEMRYVHGLAGKNARTLPEQSILF